MGIEVFVLVLITFMFIGSLIATEANDLLSSVIAIGAVGFGLSVIDLLLGAPDLAFPQILVEVIALVLLIRVVVTRRERREERVETSRDTLRIAVVLLGAGVFLVAVFVGLGGLKSAEVGETIPPFGTPLLVHSADDPVGPGVGKDYLEGSLVDTGAPNAVMGVLLDYRAYDTLGEATVIFVSILGCYALLRKSGRRKEVAKS
ncbi:MAG TPA: hydrogen gas-evolving membrane-bound hydrogenase subunit E [Planctomycetota bacterium]|nr:hydrogen gas-evolving membrane-bound hydrogenase subunit E [Planctomycetota bacterium]